MADSREEIQIAIETTKAQAEIKRLSQEIDAARATIVEADKALNQNRITQEVYDRYVQAAGKSIAENTALLKQHKQAIDAVNESQGTNQQATKKTSESIDAFSGKTRKVKDDLDEVRQRGQYAVTNLGRSFQDFSAAGLGGVTNNVEQLVSGFGDLAEAGLDAFTGPAGIAAGLTVVTVALNAFMPQIQQFLSALNPYGVEEFTTSLGRLGDRIKELEAKPLKVGVEYAELDEAKREQARFQQGITLSDQYREARTPEEAKAGSALKEALAASGFGVGGEYGKIEDALARQIAEELARGSSDLWAKQQERAQTQADIEWHGGAARGGPDQAERFRKLARIDEAIGQITSDLQRRAKSQAADLFGEAYKGGGQQRETLAQYLDKIGRGDVSGIVRSDTTAEADRQKAQSERVSKEGERVSRRYWETVEMTTDQFRAEAKLLAEIGEYQLADLAERRADQQDKEAERDARKKIGQILRQTADRLVDDFKRDARAREEQRKFETAVFEEKMAGSQEEQDKAASESKREIDDVKAKSRDRVEATGAGDYAANLIYQLRAGKMHGGAGLGKEEAEQMAVQEIARQAQMSKFAGGMGLSEAEATFFASEAVRGKGGGAEQANEALSRFPQNAQELKEAVKAQTEVLRESVRQGIPLVVRARRGGGRKRR